MKKVLSLSLILLVLLSCQKSFSVASIENSQQKFTSEYTQIDSSIEKGITPYRVELEKSMGEVIVLANKDLAKGKPESLLGNLLADATLSVARKYSKPLDIAIINYGGIRVPSISEGNVSLGNVYELMPFDNYLVVLELDGSTLLEVCDLIARKGGWPIAGLSFMIKDEKATNVLIQGETLVVEGKYKVAISDYLANGGDNLSMLKGLPQENTNVLLRDAFIEYFETLHEQGVVLDAELENRITNE